MADTVREFVVNSLNQYHNTLIDDTLNDYVSKEELSNQSYAGYSYVYAAYSYILTSIIDNEYVTALAVNAQNDRLTSLENAGYLTSHQDLSDYVSKTELSSQGYLTSHQSLDDYATENYVDTAVANLVDSAPETLNTLNELADALGNDANFSTTVTTLIGTKVSKDELSNQSYVTTTTLSAQGYLTSHQDLSDYVSKTELSSQSYLTSFTESDPVFTASAASGITSSNISNWNSYQTNVIESITFNGTTAAITNKVAAITSTEIPSYSASDSGKVLSIDDSGNLVWITPVSIYSGSSTPLSTTGVNGDLYLQTEE